MTLGKIILAAGLSILLSLSTSAAAQSSLKRGDVKIGDELDVHLVGNIMHIYYDVDFGSGVQSFIAELRVSTDGGKTFSTIPASKDITGDIGTITTRGKKEIKYDVSHNTAIFGREIYFEVRPRYIVVLKPKTFIMAGMAVFDETVPEIMVGRADKFGFYGRLRTNLVSSAANASYTTDTGWKTNDGGTFWGTGNYRASLLNISGGMMMRTTNWLYPYAGLGYGQRVLLWEDTNHKYSEVTDKTYKGLTCEAGLIFNISHVSVSLGVSNLANVDGAGLDVSIGINF